MKRYNITNDTKGGIKAVESNTGHWMVAAEVERMLEDVKPSADGIFAHIDRLTNKYKTKGKYNGN